MGAAMPKDGPLWIDARWGTSTHPVLPESLRLVWGTETLPLWLTTELQLPHETTVSALGPAFWSSTPGRTSLTERQRNFVLNLVRGRQSAIGSLSAFSGAVPYWLDVA